MKYIVVLTDGMADEPIGALGGQTPLEAAKTETLSHLAATAEIGLVSTVPEGMSPGSDVANLSVFGYPPKRFHSGRSPLEAASIGIPLIDTDVTLRANLVTLETTEDLLYSARRILDHSAGEIDTASAAVLIEALNVAFGQRFADLGLTLHTGVSYRHLLLWSHGHLENRYVPPHDILGQTIAPHLPSGDEMARALEALMQDSYTLLMAHPINQARIQAGINPANSLWFWGEGKKPALEAFGNLYGLRGHVISAVDLIKGIGHLAGLEVIEVEGATGNLHTNFAGKAAAALKGLLAGDEFSYIHLEAPDECGHQGDWQGKITAMEKIDQMVIKPLVDGLSEAAVDFRMLVVSDHPTPARLRTHTREPVPYLLYDSRRAQDAKTAGDKAQCELPPVAFHERAAAEAVASGRGQYLSEGHLLMALLTERPSPF